MPVSLKNGRYTSEGGWNSTAHGQWCICLDHETGEKVFVKDLMDHRFPESTRDPVTGREYPRLAEQERKTRAFFERSSRVDRELERIAGQGGDVILTTDFFREGQFLYKVSRIVNLQDWETGCRSMGRDDVDRMMIRLLQAVGVLHGIGLLHCDLKPENVFITEKDGMKVGLLSDFDDSIFFREKLPDGDQIMSTPEYLSPEMQLYKEEGEAYADSIGPASDIFSLAIMYHQYLTGEYPSLVRQEGAEPATTVSAAEISLGEGGVRLSEKLDPARKYIIACGLKLEPGERVKNHLEFIQMIQEARAKASRKYMIRIRDGVKPAVRKEVRVYTPFIPAAEDYEGYDLELLRTKTDTRGNIEILGFPEVKCYALVGGKRIPLEWNVQEDGTRVAVLQTADDYLIQLISGGQPMREMPVLLKASSDILVDQRTDSEGMLRVPAEAAQRDDLTLLVDGTAHQVTWNRKRCCTVELPQYTLTISQGGLPVHGEVTIYYLSGKPCELGSRRTDPEGRIAFFGLPEASRWAVKYRGESASFQWNPDLTAQVELTSPGFPVGLEVKDEAGVPIPGVPIAVQRKQGGRLSPIQKVETGENGRWTDRIPRGAAVAWKIPENLLPAGKESAAPLSGILTAENPAVRIRLRMKEAEAIFDMDVPEAYGKGRFVHLKIYRDGTCVITRGNGTLLKRKRGELGLCANLDEFAAENGV